jgi:hypothetical protein
MVRCDRNKPKSVAVSKYNVVVLDGIANDLFWNTMLYQIMWPGAV